MMLDDVLKLMMQSEMHREWFVSDLHRLIIPAIEAKKLEIMSFSGIPLGMFTYAFLPRKIEDGYISGEEKLPSDIWNYNPEDGTLYVIDFIAPHKNTLKVARWAQKVLTERYIEKYPSNGAYFIRQGKNKRLGYATGVQSELEIRRYSCAV